MGGKTGASQANSTDSAKLDAILKAISDMSLRLDKQEESNKELRSDLQGLKDSIVSQVQQAVASEVKEVTGALQEVAKKVSKMETKINLTDHKHDLLQATMAAAVHELVKNTEREHQTPGMLYVPAHKVAADFDKEAASKLVGAQVAEVKEAKKGDEVKGWKMRLSDPTELSTALKPKNKVFFKDTTPTERQEQLLIKQMRATAPGLDVWFIRGKCVVQLSPTATPCYYPLAVHTIKGGQEPITPASVERWAGIGLKLIGEAPPRNTSWQPAAPQAATPQAAVKRGAEGSTGATPAGKHARSNQGNGA